MIFLRLLRLRRCLLEQKERVTSCCTILGVLHDLFMTCPVDDM